MLLSPEARKCGFREGGYLWFEEDCCEQVVLRELMAVDAASGSDQ